jgi:outer membrane protein insertion porin family
MKKGDWYNAKMVEDTIDRLNQTLGTFGYAFADVRPSYARNKDELTMGLTFEIAEAPRVYVEKIDVNGNTLTQDKVVRREFRLAEGRRVQLAAGQAVDRADQLARLLPGKVRNRTEAWFCS